MTTPSKKRRNTTCTAGRHGSLCASTCVPVPGLRAALRSDGEPLSTRVRRHLVVPRRGLRGLATYAPTATTCPARVHRLRVGFRVRPPSRPDGNDTGGVSRDLPLDPGGVPSGHCMPVSRDVARDATGARAQSDRVPPGATSRAATNDSPPRRAPIRARRRGPVRSARPCARTTATSRFPGRRTPAWWR